MSIQEIIATKRDGKRHTEAQIRELAEGAAHGAIPDYQLAAWLMAAYLNPLDEQETAWLTVAMAESGERLDLTGLPKPWVDKHSTGGVGDKTSIVVLPLLAACGLTIAKMSGRGLGVTGGTVDKLSSIPGFRLDLTPEEMKAQAAKTGIAITGQTPDLAPADKVLYALRDVTGTVASIPLIVSSILSKKLAGGAETVVLDVKCGRGAFMRTSQEARALARSLAATGQLCGLNVRTAISDMNQPLGSAVGNAIEVHEALDILSGAELGRPTLRFRELCVELAALALHASGAAPTRPAGRQHVEEVLSNGKAKAKASEWFAAQGADIDPFADKSGLPMAPYIRVVDAIRDGWIARVDPWTIGTTVIELGGGRRQKEDVIDLSVGVEIHAGVGMTVSRDDPLFTVHARNEAEGQEAIRRVFSAITVAPMPVPEPPLFLMSG